MTAKVCSQSRFLPMSMDEQKKIIQMDFSMKKNETYYLQQMDKNWEISC